jgi:hypothetical protein
MLNPDTDEMAEPDAALMRFSGIEMTLKPSNTSTT